MVTYRKILISLLIVSTLLLTWGNPAAGKSRIVENKAPGPVENQALRLMISLRKLGFEIERGYFKLFTKADCAISYQEMGTCYGNNPAAPYVTFSVPTWAEEYVDPATDTAFGVNLDGYSTSYRLDRREAIVILGLLPPAAHYFGLQTYQFTRLGDFKKDSKPYLFMSDKPPLKRIFFTKVPQHQERVLNLSSLSNSINNVVIEKQSGAAFGQQRYFIITPDQYMDNAVRKALNMLSVKDEDIFTEPIPGNFNLGLDEAADDFVTLIRYAMPEDGGDPGDPSDVWRNRLPLVVLRIRDTRPDRLPVAYPAFTEPEKRPISNEFYLKSDLDSLVRAVSQRWGQPEAAANATMLIRTQPAPVTMVGPLCTINGMNCLADTQDTSYQYSFPLPIAKDIVYALVAPLGTKTGNATYVGLGLTSTIRMLGFDNRSDEQLENSTAAYAPGVNHTDKFFVYYFTRDCSGLKDLTDGYCVEISTDDIPDCNDPTYATCDKLSISLRDYMPLSAQRGPDDNYMLPGRVVALQRP